MLATTTATSCRIVRLMTQWIGDNKQQHWRHNVAFSCVFFLFFISIYYYFPRRLRHSLTLRASALRKIINKIKMKLPTFSVYFQSNRQYHDCDPNRRDTIDMIRIWRVRRRRRRRRLCVGCCCHHHIPVKFCFLFSLPFSAHAVCVLFAFVFVCVCVCVSHINQPQQKLFLASHLLWMKCVTASCTYFIQMACKMLTVRSLCILFWTSFFLGCPCARVVCSHRIEAHSPDTCH